ncbi:MAG: DUF4145 domain-containing protein [Acidobacteria bacterium]|nr:DUF4145 domain-containing protein [Acidobacteriota bacterium]MYH23515.1 DUF4145 domain-containing protein [Acidobacteriota bacterium]MYK79812.1 DUF4145 domain-containing protein [Acidobacteriota bacterium]
MAPLIYLENWCVNCRQWVAFDEVYFDFRSSANLEKEEVEELLQHKRVDSFRESLVVDRRLSCGECKRTLFQHLVLGNMLVDKSGKGVKSGSIREWRLVASPLYSPSYNVKEGASLLDKLYAARDSIPDDVFGDLLECYNAANLSLHKSSALMARVTLERIARLELRRTGNLHDLLGAMRSQGLLDGQISRWADHVRNIGNLVAHEPVETEMAQFLGNAILIIGIVIRYYDASVPPNQR